MSHSLQWGNAASTTNGIPITSAAYLPQECNRLTNTQWIISNSSTQKQIVPSSDSDLSASVIYTLLVNASDCYYEHVSFLSGYAGATSAFSTAFNVASSTA